MAESGVDVICERSRNVLLLGLSDDDEANRLSLLVLTGHGIGTLRKKLCYCTATFQCLCFLSDFC